MQLKFKKRVISKKEKKKKKQSLKVSTLKRKLMP